MFSANNISCIVDDFFDATPWNTKFYTVGSTGWRQPTQLYDKEGNLIVQIELPGYDKKDLTVSSEGDSIRVTVENKARGLPKKFLIPLTNKLDIKGTKAELKLGILSITVPAKSSAKPRDIPIG